MTRLGFLVVLLFTAAALGAGTRAEQTSQPAAPAPAQPATPGAAPQTPAAAQAPTPPSNYVYTPDGRRDPFVTLLTRAPDGRAAGVRVVLEGVPGMTTEELVVRGIVQSKGTLVALVTGAAGKVYTVRVGDKLADGTIRSITPQFLVIQQVINDPLSLEKQREIRKYLRGGENK
jgi:Tfp pilus assembly protein PilP